MVTTIILVMDLLGSLHLIFSGPLGGSLVIGASAPLLSYVVGALVIGFVRRGPVLTPAFLGRPSP